jgi:hypothetical protein
MESRRAGGISVCGELYTKIVKGFQEDFAISEHLPGKVKSI